MSSHNGTGNAVTIHSVGPRGSCQSVLPSTVVDSNVPRTLSTSSPSEPILPDFSATYSPDSASDSINKRVLNRRIPIEIRRKIVERYQNGERVHDIAKEFGVSDCGVRKTWARYTTTGTVRDKNVGRPLKQQNGAEKKEKDIGQTLHQFHEESGEDSGVGSQEVVMGSGTSLAASGDGIQVSTNGDLSQKSLPHSASTPHTRPSGLPSFSSSDSQHDLPSPQTPLEGKPLMNMLLFETPSMDPQRIGPVPEKYTLLKTRRGKSRRSLNRPYPREEMLPRIMDCPLAIIEKEKCNRDQRHVKNIADSKLKPLYGECLWGFPFGRAPDALPFQPTFSRKEDNPIVSDPANPIAKDLLVELGYSTQVYFNACCKPPRSLDFSKVTNLLPYTIEASTLDESTLKFFQVILSISADPHAVFECIPKGLGPSLSLASESSSKLHQRQIYTPVTLSQFWSLIVGFAVEQLLCCENFVSATPPSSPCLVCHPFVREPTPPPSPLQAPQADPSGLSDPQASPPPGKRQCSSKEGLWRESHIETQQEEMDVQALSPDQSISGARREVQPPSSLGSIPPLPSPSVVQGSSPMVALQGVQFRATSPSTFPIPSSKPVGSEIPIYFPPFLPPSPSQVVKSSPQQYPPPLIQLISLMSRGKGPSVPFPWSPLVKTVQSANPVPSSTLHMGQPQLPRLSSHVGPHEVPFSAGISTHSQQPLSSPEEMSKRIAEPARSSPSPSKVPSREHTRRQSAALPQKSSATPTSSQIGLEQTTKGSSQTLLEEPFPARLYLPSDSPPSEWSVEDVMVFVERVTNQECGKIFKAEEIDGIALQALTTDVMVNMMNLKIGPALKLAQVINSLKEKFGIFSPQKERTTR